MTIPKVSQKALTEACELIASKKIFGLPQEQFVTYLSKYNKDLKTRQPEIYKFLVDLIQQNQATFKDNKQFAHMIPMFCSIMINAMYIQAEIDEISKLFGDTE